MRSIPRFQSTAHGIGEHLPRWILRDNLVISGFSRRVLFVLSSQQIANDVDRLPRNLVRSRRDRVLSIAVEFRARVSIVQWRGKA